MSTLNTSEGLGRTPARSRRYAHAVHGITDLDHAPPRQAIPLDVLEPLFDAWNDGIERAKRAYYGKTYLDRRIARAEANQRWRAKKKGQQQ